MLEILGVHRNRKFSPNHIGNDDAIFTLTTRALSEAGFNVRTCSEDEFLRQDEVPEAFLFTMARQKAVVQKLQNLETGGALVLNSGFGIENCYRIKMHTILEQHGIPVPQSLAVPTLSAAEEVFEQLPGKGYWIKRGDFHAIHKEDVSFVASPQEGREMLREFAFRDITEALVSENLVGDLVKFYAVRGTDFFYWFYPYDHNHHKYAEYERINGRSHHYSFDEADLRRVATEAAAALNVDIYGGDAIVTKDGSFYIIDLNDWPSFAPCRQDAADAIAALLLQRFTPHSVAWI